MYTDISSDLKDMIIIFEFSNFASYNFVNSYNLQYDNFVTDRWYLSGHSNFVRVGRLKAEVCEQHWPSY